MQDVNVVVIFHGEPAERLALAAAVGAVQGRANIRLRRLRNNGEAHSEMDTEYVEPRDADAEWADAIIAGIPAEADTVATVFERYFDSLEGKCRRKIGASFTEGAGIVSLYAAMQRAGLVTVEMISAADPREAARLQGRRVAETARSLRNQV